jgi:O-methyltransferase domain
VPVIWSAYGELEHAVRTGHPAVEKALPEGFFAYMAANPNLARVFDEAMTANAHAQIPAILGSYDFSRFNKIADIAGGRGHLLKGAPRETAQRERRPVRAATRERRGEGMNSRPNRMDWASVESSNK